MKERDLPIFLGVSRRVALDGPIWNILGLSKAVPFPVFPQSFSSFKCLIAVGPSLQKISEPIKYRINLIDKKEPSRNAYSDHTISPHETHESNKIESLKEGDLNNGNDFTRFEPDLGEGFRLLAFQMPDLVLPEPTTVKMSLDINDQEYHLGEIECLFNPPAPITKKERRAIKSKPDAIKGVKVAICCQECENKAEYYKLLDPSERTPEDFEDSKPISKADSNWICGCQETAIPLHYLKQGLHAYFRGTKDSAKDTGLANVSLPLYEANRIDSIIFEYQELINNDPPEEEVQKYLENNPLFWSFLSPNLILHKPDILTKYNADFGILSNKNIFYFVEIERPGINLVNQSGKISEEIQKGAGQIRDWDIVVSNNKQTVLSELEISQDLVHEIRYILIGGLVDKVSSEKIAKLRRNNFGPNTEFFGFDELTSFLKTLKTNLRRL